jgi:serine/threonine-protein kinase
VLIDPDGRAKLTDFGISRSLEAADGLTQAGKVVGTTDYVSPEQALGHDVSGQSDIYSLGICLYEMLAGRPPFTGESHVAVAMKHVQEPVPDIRQRRPEVSAVLAAVVERATSKELGNRYQSIDEMVADLEQALAIEAARSGEVTGEATAVLQQLPRSARRLAPRRLLAPHRIAIALLVVLALAGATYAAVLLIPGGARLVQLPGIDSDLTKVNLDLGSARDFDPEGDGAENTDEVDLAIDGNRSTYWDSEGYQVEFGPAGLKSGVGLVIDAGTPVVARQLDLIMRTEGIDLQVYAAEQPSEDLGGWGPVIGSATDAKEVTEIDLDTAGQQFQYYLLWITRVVPDGDANRASISELILRQ